MNDKKKIALVGMLTLMAIITTIFIINFKVKINSDLDKINNVQMKVNALYSNNKEKLAEGITQAEIDEVNKLYALEKENQFFNDLKDTKKYIDTAEKMLELKNSVDSLFDKNGTIKNINTDLIASVENKAKELKNTKRVFVDEQMLKINEAKAQINAIEIATDKVNALFIDSNYNTANPEVTRDLVNDASTYIDKIKQIKAKTNLQEKLKLVNQFLLEKEEAEELKTSSNTSSKQNSSQLQSNSNTNDNQSNLTTDNNENTTQFQTLSSDFVNIKSLDSSIIVELIYNTPNNFTGERIYDFHQGILRTSTANKLVNANSILKSKGYVIKIWDTYRPLSAQEALWQAYPDANFVAKPDPNNIRGHQLGATIDMTICTLDGVEVEMQSDFDDFSSKAHRNYQRTDEQENNYNIMHSAMTEAGFIGYENEWWEYRDTNQNFTPLQVDPNDY